MNTTAASGNAAAAAATVSSPPRPDRNTGVLTSLLQTTNDYKYTNNDNFSYASYPSATMPVGAGIKPSSAVWQAALDEMIEEERLLADAKARALAAVEQAVRLMEGEQKRVEEEEERRDSVRELFPGKMGGVKRRRVRFE